MEPNFEKANEIYFRLGIIYKQQEKYRQSLEVSELIGSSFLPECANDGGPVLSLYRCRSSASTYRRGYLVSDWPCIRAAEGCEFIDCDIFLSTL